MYVQKKVNKHLTEWITLETALFYVETILKLAINELHVYWCILATIRSCLKFSCTGVKVKKAETCHTQSHIDFCMQRKDNFVRVLDKRYCY